jgi:DNA-binding YbaB/EbfC family protein
MDINPFDLLKNAQKIQEQMGAFQNKLAGISVTGSSGGGMVEVELNGKFEVIAVRIAPEAVEGGDAEMLADLVAAAFSSSLEKVRAAVSGEMGAMAGGLGIQGFTGNPSGFPGFS